MILANAHGRPEAPGKRCSTGPRPGPVSAASHSVAWNAVSNGPQAEARRSPFSPARATTGQGPPAKTSQGIWQPSAAGAGQDIDGGTSPIRSVSIGSSAVAGFGTDAHASGGVANAAGGRVSAVPCCWQRRMKGGRASTRTLLPGASGEPKHGRRRRDAIPPWICAVFTRPGSRASALRPRRSSRVLSSNRWPDNRPVS